MKRALIVVGALLLMQGSSPGQVSVSFGMFYSSLDPYGEWIPMDGGVYGWRPVQVVGDWRPYTVGRWVWTSDGWYWVSEEPWGWATYHYGRWYYDDFYGWIWIPGYDWAPAWVEWRYGGNYIGWAPLSPYAIWGLHFGIRYRYRWATPYHWWAFVDCGHIASPGIHRHVYRAQENQRYIGRTRVAGNVRYRNGRIVAQGPGREFVERRGRIRLETTEVVETRSRGERVMKEGGRERIEVYRPRIEDRRLDVVEKPARIREGDRRVDLDAGSLDVRSRSLDRATRRDPGKSEEYRRREREMQRDTPPLDQPGREESARPAPKAAEERMIERKRPERLSPARSGEERPAPRAPEGKGVDRKRSERPSGEQGRGSDRLTPRQPDRPRPSPEVERPRPPKEEYRSPSLEQTTRRPPEARPEQRKSGGGGREGT